MTEELKTHKASIEILAIAKKYDVAIVGEVFDKKVVENKSTSTFFMHSSVAHLMAHLKNSKEKLIGIACGNEDKDD